MIECPNCHQQIKKEVKFCPHCGKQLIDNKKQFQNNQNKKSVNSDFFEKIAPNQQNLSKVFVFAERNTITIFAFFLLAVLFDPLRWVLLLLLIALLYFYPLLSNKTEFPWNIKLSNDNKKNVVKSEEYNPTKVVQEPKEPKSTVTKPHQSINQAKSVMSTKNGFVTTGELWLGIICLVIGLCLYFIGKSQTQDVGSQVISVVQQGSLNNGGYLYILGGALADFGILATIGGLVKGYTHNLNSGVVFKVVGVIILVIAASLAIYSYANPVETAVNAYRSGIGIDDVQNIVQLAKIIPWIAGIIYAVGILLSAIKPSK